MHQKMPEIFLSHGKAKRLKAAVPLSGVIVFRCSGFG